MQSPSFGPPPPTSINLGEGPGKTLAPVQAIVTVGVFHAALVILIVYGFIGLWPRPTPSGEKRTQLQTPSASVQPTNVPPSNAPPPGAATSASTNPPSRKIDVVAEKEQSEYLDPQTGSLFRLEFTLYNDVRLFVLVLLAGALGTCVHALRSISWYAGNGAFVTSWLLYYYLRPLTGAGLAATFYFVIRGGFFSSSANFSQTSPFGFCALAALIGLFSESAILKLKDIADTVFVKPKAGSDSVPQPGTSGQPTAGPNQPSSGPVGGIPGAPNPPPPRR